MNKIYKIIWSEVRQCYVVVAEIARNRGKNNVRTIVEGLAAHTLALAGRWALPFVTAGLLLQPVQPLLQETKCTIFMRRSLYKMKM